MQLAFKWKPRPLLSPPSPTFFFPLTFLQAKHTMLFFTLFSLLIILLPILALTPHPHLSSLTHSCPLSLLPSHVRSSFLPFFPSFFLSPLPLWFLLTFLTSFPLYHPPPCFPPSIYCSYPLYDLLHVLLDTVHLSICLLLLATIPPPLLFFFCLFSHATASRPLSVFVYRLLLSRSSRI